MKKYDRLGPTFIGMVGYADLEYQDIDTFSEVNCVYREELVGEIEKGLGNGQVWVHSCSCCCCWDKMDGQLSECLSFDAMPF